MPPSDESMLARLQAAGQAPLIAHILYRLDVGGLENGLVNLVNSLPSSRFRHAIICLADYTDFSKRITNPDVALFALNKPPGNSPRMHLRLWQLLRQLKPCLAHSRNMAALECQITAFLAGVPARVHSEHGRDMGDLDGRNRVDLGIRRSLRPLVHRYIALSQDLQTYLRTAVQVDAGKLSQIYNGVDTNRFRPGLERAVLPHPMFERSDTIVVGTVGRMEPVKDPVNLARAFAHCAEAMPDVRERLRLVMVGDGRLRSQVEEVIAAAGLSGQTWLTGARGGVDDILRGLDIFVLPSLSEGISNTILEAMASGLPIVATRTGGNPELVQDGDTGLLPPPNDSAALAQAIGQYIRNPEQRKSHGARARQVALERYSLGAMVNRYADIYRQLLEQRCPKALVAVREA